MTNKSTVMKNLVATAKSILENKINIIAASRKINNLRFELDPENDLFTLFRAIDSDTDDYPILESQRRLWNQEALKKLDLEVNKYIDSVKPSVYKKCQEIIDKYGSDIQE